MWLCALCYISCICIMYVYDVQELAVWLSLPIRVENIQIRAENLTCIAFKEDSFEQNTELVWGWVRDWPSTNPLIYYGALPARYTVAIVSRSCGSNQPVSDWNLSPLPEVEPVPDTALVAKGLRRDRPWLQGKSKYYCSGKGTLKLNDFYGHSTLCIDLAQPFSEKFLLAA